MAVFPCDEDVYIMCHTKFDRTLYLYQVATKSQRELQRDGVDFVDRVDTCPGADTHPVLLARRLLILALYIQSLPRFHIEGLAEAPAVIMQRFADTAITLLTTNEELLGSTESLECIILEAVFQANSGNIRRAWLAIRRAMMVGQMMGLHRTPMPVLKSIEGDIEINAKFVWFRIVYADRLLSLMLGLPQGSTDRNMVSDKAMNDDTPSGRLQRIHAVVAARIIERNERCQIAQDYGETQSMDADMLRMAQGMPDKFWLPPKFADPDMSTHDRFWDSTRLVDQIFHFSLLMLVHLPYSFSHPGARAEAKYEYSKWTCLSASREVLARFTCYESLERVGLCCRPMEFFALLASIWLLTSHLGGHDYKQTPSILAHQRPGDRALVEEVLGNMKRMATTNADAMMAKSASLLEQLLRIEAEAARRPFDSVGAEGFTKSQEMEENILRVPIPYAGVLKLSRYGIDCEGAQGMTDPDMLNPEYVKIHGPTMADGSIEISGKVTPIFGEAPELSQSLQAEEVTSSMQSDLDPTPQIGQPQFFWDDINMPQSDAYSRMAAGADEWAFQGVDTAFFGNIFMGKMFPSHDGTGNSDWAGTWNGDAPMS